MSPIVSSANGRHVIILGSFVVIVALTILAYYPGLHGPLVFDDYVNFVDKDAIAIQSLDFPNLFNAALSNESGILKRPLPALSFALNYYFSGGFTNTIQFKATNLAIHITNACLVYWLVTLLLETHIKTTKPFHSKWHIWLPTLIAAVWALHPLQVTSVLYVVQRMTSLSALFVLAGLIVFVYGRRFLHNQNPHGIRLMWGGLLGGTFLGLVCKENAALLPFYALAIEFVFFHGNRDRQFQPRLTPIYVILFVLIVLLALFWLIRNPALILNAYNLREFTLNERLLTESRVLWFYIGLLLFPASNRFTLFHDDIPLSSGLFNPWTTVVALAGLLLAVVVAIVGRKKTPLLSFSILWFLAGHIMESSFIGLELVHEHRNYLPSLAPIFSGIYGAAIILERFKSKMLSISLSILAIATMVFATHSVATTWSSERNLATSMLENHPESARSHAMVADLYLQKQKDPIQALNHYKIAADLAPYETSYLIRMVIVTAFTVAQLEEIKPAIHALTQEEKLPPGLITIRQNNEGIRLSLSQSLHDKISQQLQSQPVQGRVEDRLTELTNCVLIESDYCSGLYNDAIDWNTLALNNLRSNDSIRKALLLNLAKLYLEHGNLEGALGIAERSKTMDPYQPVLAIMRANIYFIANRLDDAEKTILSVKQRGLILDKDNREQADKLLSMIIKQQHNGGLK